MLTTEIIYQSDLILFLLCIAVVGIFAIIFLLAALVRALTKEKPIPTIDDPTGEKKQKIYDSLVRVIDDLKTTV